MIHPQGVPTPTMKGGVLTCISLGTMTSNGAALVIGDSSTKRRLRIMRLMSDFLEEA
jgi:hypothetical protein